MQEAEQGQRREEKVEGEGEGKKGNEKDRKMWGKNREIREKKKRGIGDAKRGASRMKGKGQEARERKKGDEKG